MCMSGCLATSHVEEFVAHAQLAQHMEVKKHQQIQFQRILDKNAKNKDIKGSEDRNLASEIMSRWVKNCSDHLLSDLELRRNIQPG